MKCIRLLSTFAWKFAKKHVLPKKSSRKHQIPRDRRALMTKRSKLQKKIRRSTNHQSKENVLNQIKEIDENKLKISINTFHTLSGHTGRALVWHSEDRTFAADSAQQVLWFAALITVCNSWSSGGTALCRVGGATSQLNLSSLTPLSVAGCDWLQPGAPHWATSVNYCK